MPFTTTLRILCNHFQVHQRSPPYYMAQDDHFDADYYRRFYGDKRTRVVSQPSVRRLATFIVGYARFLGLPLRNALDIGCGVGHWRTALNKLCRSTRYHGVEFSSYLCERHGWTRGSVVDYAPHRSFDLVICQGVLQYLDDAAAAKAINNLAKLCRGALYLEALTQRDWDTNCDRSVTDGAVHLRTGAWYQKRLAKEFTPLGGGMFKARSARITSFELETLG